MGFSDPESAVQEHARASAKIWYRTVAGVRYEAHRRGNPVIRALALLTPCVLEGALSKLLSTNYSITLTTQKATAAQLAALKPMNSITKERSPHQPILNSPTASPTESAKVRPILHLAQVKHELSSIIHSTKGVPLPVFTLYSTSKSASARDDPPSLRPRRRIHVPCPCSAHNPKTYVPLLFTNLR
jgi:hypothetical protein